MKQIGEQTKRFNLQGIDLEIRIANEAPKFSELSRTEQGQQMLWVGILVGIPMPELLSLNIILEQIAKYHPNLTTAEWKLAFEYNLSLAEQKVAYQLFSWNFVNDVLKQFKAYQGKLITSHKEKPKEMTEEEIKKLNEEANIKLYDDLVNKIYPLWKLNNECEIWGAQAYYDALDKLGVIKISLEEKNNAIEYAKRKLIAEYTEKHEIGFSKNIRAVMYGEKSQNVIIINTAKDVLLRKWMKTYIPKQ